MKTIGILGGLGPESTCEFYRLITRCYYDMYGNYKYPEILIYSISFEKIIESGYKSAGDIKHAIECLHKAGADFVVAACNSIHIIFDEVKNDIPIPWISIMETTAENILEKKIKKVGLLGTRFTMSEGFYRNALANYGIETIIPPEDSLEKINAIIYNELVRNILEEKSKLYIINCINNLIRQGAQGIILGCTELPFLIDQSDTKVPVFNTTALHAQKTLELALSISL
ncbi:MAG: amino acid racemase [Candidatus Latescibacteria bacterium]|nr:amino acid racemase [Candidatus Latescibacterota bacterium]